MTDAQDADGAGRSRGAEADAAPSTDVTVEAHLHFGMTGSFPLRVAELFFADDGLYVAEYGYITPFIGLTAKKHRREARAMQAVYDKYGLDAVLFQADTVYWHSYDDIERVAVHEGGGFGRPKVAVYPRTGASHAYRFHDVPRFEEAVGDLEASAQRHGLHLEHESGLGVTPRESLKRFFWKPEDEE